MPHILLDAGWTKSTINHREYWRPPRYYEVDGQPHHFDYASACAVEALDDPVAQFVTDYLAEEARLEWLRRQWEQVESGALPRRGQPPNY